MVNYKKEVYKMTKTITKQVKDLTFKDLNEICINQRDCFSNCPLYIAKICHGDYSHEEVFERGAEHPEVVITFETNNAEYIKNETMTQANTKSCERKNYLWVYDECDSMEVISLTEDQVRLFNYIANCASIGKLEEFICKEI